MFVETRWNQYHRRLPLFAASGFVAISCLGLNETFNKVDDSYYLVLAKAIATGQGYTNICLPHPVPHTHFPPGLPLLLSLPMLLGLPLGVTVIISKLILIVCGGSALLAFASLIRLEGYGEPTRTWAVVLSAVSVVLIAFSCRVASEFPYMLLSVLALLAVQRYLQSRYLSWWGPLASVLLTTAILTRSIGFVLLGAVAVHLTLNRRFRRLVVVLAPSAVILLVWFWHTRGGAGTTEYFKEFAALYRWSRSHPTSLGLFAQPAANLWALISVDIPRTVASLLSSQAVLSRPSLATITLPLRVGVSLLVLWQLISRRSMAGSPIGLYVVFYLILVTVYPWEPSRFVVPILPFLCLYFVETLRRLLEWMTRRLQVKAVAATTLLSAAMVICVVSQIVSDAHYVATTITTGDFSVQAAAARTEVLDAYRWLDENTADSSVIGCIPTIEANIYLLAGRKAMPLPIAADAWPRFHIDYVIAVCDDSTYGGIERRVESRAIKTLRSVIDKGDAVSVYQNRCVAIYKVQGSDLRPASLKN